jgi:SRSO17 transposase
VVVREVIIPYLVSGKVNMELGLILALVQTSELKFGVWMSKMPRVPPQPAGKADTLRVRRVMGTSQKLLWYW